MTKIFSALFLHHSTSALPLGDGLLSKGNLPMTSNRSATVQSIGTLTTLAISEHRPRPHVSLGPYPGSTLTSCVRLKPRHHCLHSIFLSSL